LSAAYQPGFDFEAAQTAADDGEALIVDLDGFEGPLHLLLALARTQKVDLRQLSVLKLAEQYAAFVADARRRRFALAADYLVMASWLAYLKSRLLLPKPEKLKPEEAPAETVAAALAFRLAKLDAMRRAAETLQARPRLGQDVFPRGDPEAIKIVPSGRVDVSVSDLVAALVAQRQRTEAGRYRPKPVEAYGLEDARDRLRLLLPALNVWTSLQGIAPAAGAGEGPSRASCLASTLSASLELVKEGALDARQDEAFADIYLRRRREAAAPAPLEAAA
jgi:segregation and condensation protein A